MTEKSEKNNKGISSAYNVFRLSPRDLFEVLLGEPDERGYDEEMLKEANEQAPNFACDRRFSWPYTNEKDKNKK